MTTIDSLKEDAKRAHDISCECGGALRAPYHNDEGKRDRFLWALAVGQLHIIEWILKKGEWK